MDVWLAKPRGFCSGVVKAIKTVEEALQKYGPPVYVRHEIVHNKHVIKDLQIKGVVFVEEIDEIPPGKPVVFSAHGVSIEVFKRAKKLGLEFIDATCPLVRKVHDQVKKIADEGCEIIIIGKKDHPEIIGTLGQIPVGKKNFVVGSVKEAEALELSKDAKVGFVTQTTLSVDDTAEIVAYLKSRFVNLKAMKESDICYATTTRQKAVKALAEKAEKIVILGSKNSSNSNHLKEVALRNGACEAFLIDDESEFEYKWLQGIKAVGISAGASAPEYLVKNLVLKIKSFYENVKVYEVG